MITGTGSARRPRNPLLTTGLPLREPMPLHLTPPSGSEPAAEGPLALDYRTWGGEVGQPQMAAPDDVTYTLTGVKISYDGKYYYYTKVDQVDDK
jgi:hypothetical protein